MRFRASANTSAAVSKGCSRMSLRTKLAFFIPALRDLRASIRASSSVNRTVRIAILELIIDVCHLYVNRPMLDLVHSHAAQSTPQSLTMTVGRQRNAVPVHRRTSSRAKTAAADINHARAIGRPLRLRRTNRGCHLTGGTHG